MRRCKQKDPFNKQLRNKCYELHKKYNKLIRKKKRSFQSEMINNVGSINVQISMTTMHPATKTSNKHIAYFSMPIILKLLTPNLTSNCKAVKNLSITYQQFPIALLACDYQNQLINNLRNQLI